MNDLVKLSETASNLSREYIMLRDAAGALRWAEQATESSRQAGTVQGQADAALALAWACIVRGDVPRALSSVETAQQLARKMGVELSHLGSPLNPLIPGLVHAFLGDWDKAEMEFLKALAFSEQTHNRAVQMLWCVPALGWLCLERETLAGAKTYLGEAAAFSQSAGDNPPELLARALLVQVGCKAGELAEAEDHMRRAREIFSLSPDWLGLTAEVHLAEGVLATAQERWP